MQWYTSRNFIQESSIFSFAKKFPTGAQLYIKTAFLNTTLLEYQKELMKDFTWKVLEHLQDENITEQETKVFFKESIQTLNTTLQAFAAKVDETEQFSIKWVVRLIANWILMCSLIWDVSLFILRDNKIHYHMNNQIDVDASVDVFSDFIEWEMDFNDFILLIWTNYTNVLDKKELKQINEVLASSDINILDFVEKLFGTKIEAETLGFLDMLDYWSSADNIWLIQWRNKKKWLQIQLAGIKNVQRLLIKNKYLITVSILSVVVCVLWYTIITDMFRQTQDIPQIETKQGSVIVTPESIQKEIAYFQRLEATSSTKSEKYQEIMEQIEFLEGLWKRPEDIQILKKVVQNMYYEWFNVIYINDIETNSDTPSIYTFTSTEKETLSSPVALVYTDKIMVWGKQWAILWAINNDIKWTQVPYNRDSGVVGCSSDLSRQWLYCFDEWNNIMLITKWSVQPVSIQKESEEALQISFDNPIKDIGVFNKNAMYLLHADPDLNRDWEYITKHVVSPWRFDMFWEWTKYEIVGSIWSWVRLNLNSFVIDWSFLARSSDDTSLLQLRRDNSPIQINARSIILEWWDTVEDTYSADVKVLASVNSKYIYLFDKTNQTFTVYTSAPLKTNERFAFSYNLSYVFRFKFDLWENMIIDASIPEEQWKQPYLYLLTQNWVHQVALNDFIVQFSE